MIGEYCVKKRRTTCGDVAGKGQGKPVANVINYGGISSRQGSLPITSSDSVIADIALNKKDPESYMLDHVVSHGREVEGAH